MPNLPRYAGNLNLVFRFLIKALLFALIGIPAVIMAERSQPVLTAKDPIEFDGEKRQLVASNNAELCTEDCFLRADKIYCHTTSSQVEASGNICFYKKPLRIVSEQGFYNYKEKKMQTGPLRVGSPPLYAEAQQLSGNENALIFSQNKLFFAEPDFFGFHIKIQKLSLFPEENRFSAKKNIFYLGPLPCFYTPSYSQKTPYEFPFTLQSQFGFLDYLGFYNRNTLFLRGYPTFKPGGFLDYYSKRGFLLGPGMRYRQEEPSNTFGGHLLTGFIRDHAAKNNFDLLQQPLSSNRFFVEWNHNQRLHEKFDITGRVSWWGDSEVTRDFRPNFFYDNQQPDNYLEGVSIGKNSLFSAFVRFRPNHFERIQERLPELRVDLPWTEFSQSSLYYLASGSYVQLHEKSLTGATTLPGGYSELHSNRLDFHYGLKRPFSPTHWLTFSPMVAMHLTQYHHTLTTKNTYTRLLGEVGCDLQLQMAGQWSYANSIWGINGIRHLLQPIFQYRFLPNGQSGKGIIPEIDTRLPRFAYPEIINLSEKRNIDTLYHENCIRLGLENLLQTRHTEYGARDLLSLNLYQDIRFAKTPERSHYSNLYTQLEISPAYWFRFNLSSRLNTEDLTLQEFHSHIQLLDGEAWSLYLSSDNLQKELDQYYIDFSYKLSERHQVSGTWRYDAYLHQLTEQTYAFKTFLGNSWGIEYKMTYRHGTSRENNWGFSINFKLLSI